MKKSAVFGKYLLLVPLIIAVFGGIYWFFLKQPEKYTGPVEKVTLGVESSLLPAAVWIAEGKDYFQEEGLDLTIKEYDSGRLSLLAMLEGNKGINISAAAPTPIMFNGFKNQDFSIFATFAYAYEDIKVIARKDKGITTAADLKGKKIGTPMGTTGQFFTETFLIYNAVSPEDVELVDVAPSNLPSALNKGEVEAIVIWEPHGSSARELLGNKAIRLPSSEVYKTTFNFLVMNDFAEEYPEVLIKFLKAIDRATTFIGKNKEDSQAIVARRLKLEKEAVALHWDEFAFEVSLNQSLLTGLEDEARWAIKNNLTSATKVPNYLNFIYLDALEAVRPEVVTIIR